MSYVRNLKAKYLLNIQQINFFPLVNNSNYWVRYLVSNT